MLLDKREVLRQLVHTLDQRNTPWPLPRARTAKGLIKGVGRRFDAGDAKRDRNNRAPLYVMMKAVEVYNRTGDRDYLALFKGLMWE